MKSLAAFAIIGLLVLAIVASPITAGWVLLQCLAFAVIFAGLERLSRWLP